MLLLVNPSNQAIKSINQPPNQFNQTVKCQIIFALFFSPFRFLPNVSNLCLYGYGTCCSAARSIQDTGAPSLSPLLLQAVAASVCLSSAFGGRDASGRRTDGVARRSRTTLVWLAERVQRCKKLALRVLWCRPYAAFFSRPSVDSLFASFHATTCGRRKIGRPEGSQLQTRAPSGVRVVHARLTPSLAYDTSVPRFVS